MCLWREESGWDGFLVVVWLLACSLDLPNGHASLVMREGGMGVGRCLPLGGGGARVAWLRFSEGPAWSRRQGDGGMNGEIPNL